MHDSTPGYLSTSSRVAIIGFYRVESGADALIHFRIDAIQDNALNDADKAQLSFANDKVNLSKCIDPLQRAQDFSKLVGSKEIFTVRVMLEMLCAYFGMNVGQHAAHNTN